MHFAPCGFIQAKLKMLNLHYSFQNNFPHFLRAMLKYNFLGKKESPAQVTKIHMLPSDFSVFVLQHLPEWLTMHGYMRTTKRLNKQNEKKANVCSFRPCVPS